MTETISNPKYINYLIEECYEEYYNPYIAQISVII